MSDPIYLQLAQELGLDLRQVERSAALLAEGNTIPFITRYRKEVTGGLDEEQLRRLAERLDYLRNLELRRAEVRALAVRMRLPFVDDPTNEREDLPRTAVRHRTDGFTEPIAQSRCP